MINIFIICIAQYVLTSVITYIIFVIGVSANIKIKGFLNYEEKKWIRYYRRIEREANSTIWDGDDDVLDMCILFGLKKYEPEDWN